MTATTPEAGAFGFSDAARRISDAANTALLNGARDEWLAFALSDGSVEGMPDNPRTYPHRQDAVRAQGHSAANYGYLKVPWDGVTPRAAEVFLKIQRQVKDIGYQLIDPEVSDRDYRLNHLRESTPSLDRRGILTRNRYDGTGAAGRERRSPGGLILP